jgi:mono/diheme cytochrome c family protein
LLLAALALLVAGCRRDMQDQPRYEPFERSTFFDDKRAARPPVPGSVARGQLNEDDAVFRGQQGGSPLADIPLVLDANLLRRGRERYDVYCSPCHDRVGTGKGMIVQRGFKAPPSLHDERLRNAPVGHFFQVMTGGFGVMSGYAAQIPPRDRWAIVGYIRALQLSQHAALDDVPPQERAKLEQERDPAQ